MNELSLAENAIDTGNENELGCFERVGERYRHMIRINPVSLAISIESKRGDYRNHSLSEQRLKKLRIDALHFAGKKMVHSLQNAHRMGNHAIGAGGTKIIGRQALQNFVSQAIGGRQGKFQGRGISDSAAI